MNKFDDIFNKVIHDDKSIFDVLKEPKEFPLDLIDKLSIEVAIGYWNKNMHFEDADIFMNEVFSFWLDNFSENTELSGIVMDCYLAFEEGEFKRPSERYTRPLIKEYIEKYNLRERKN